jgi:hypothetical protein
MTSFLKKLLGRQPNRTASWQATANDPLAVDLTAYRFCGVAIGDPIDNLSFLGPAENPYEQAHTYNYFQRGFYLVDDNGQLETVVFLLALDPSMPRVRPFVGNWLHNGRSLHLTDQTQPQDLRRDLGEPFHEYSEETNDVIWFYESPGVEWQFAWSPTGQLASVELGLPELAYPEARDLYQVSKPWTF